MAFAESGGVPLRKSGLFESGPSAGEVVWNPARQEDAILEIVEHVAGARIVIPWLAHAADIDRVALGGVEAHGLIGGMESLAIGRRGFLPDRRDMGMAIETDEGGLLAEMCCRFLWGIDVVKFRWLVERGVGEGEGIDIRSERLGAEPLALFF